MLAEERLERIAALVDERGTVSSSELMETLGASDSTVRRDLTRLAQEGRIVKVHGGARAVGAASRLSVVSMDQTVGQLVETLRQDFGSDMFSALMYSDDPGRLRRLVNYWFGMGGDA